MNYPVTIGPFVEAKVKEGATFPVSVADFKTFHQIDFNDHDTYIGTIVKAATFRVETYTGCSIVGKEVEVKYESLDGEAVELPRGPVLTTPVVKIANEVVTSGYQLSTGYWPVLEMESVAPVAITYETGYTTQTVPEQLKIAILWQAWEQFMQKTSKVKTNWKGYAADFRRPNRCL